MPFISGRLRASASGIIFSCSGVGRNLLVLTCQITRIAFCRGCSNCSLFTSIIRIDVHVNLWYIWYVWHALNTILLTTYSLCSQPIHWYPNDVPRRFTPNWISRAIRRFAFLERTKFIIFYFISFALARRRRFAIYETLTDFNAEWRNAK